ncbi:hypothetical protein RHMOL_Rhmol02G0275500 [Rhododendron molle]|uniref:Uncharacterized protein n=1 Tax=Rhododendron molle TaxID=49168 RepID=A0ACC0PWG9_RHOML|nr:hypothetical protein RHMOL_Rhmol02G0275500 [Rhododendron molle]
MFRRKRDQVRSNVRESVHIGLKDGGCPFGTVPIRRITKEDLIKERNVSKIRPLDEYAFAAHYAVVRTKRGTGKFNGAGATLSLHNPQVSRGQSHCFNTRCPEFVLVRSDIPLDGIYENTSKPGGQIYEIHRYIQRDLANGNWWLLIGANNIPIGFWPKRIFSDLTDSASYVEWGGMVYSPPGTLTPAMGSGHYIGELDTRNNAYLRNIEVFNDQGRNVDAYNTETFADFTAFYTAEDIKNFKSFRHLVLYGGPPQKFV